MKRSKTKPSYQVYALGWQSFFFSYTFWVLALLISFSVIALYKTVDSFQQQRVTYLIERTAFSGLTVESKADCGTSSHLVFQYNILGIANRSCYTKQDDGLLQLYNGVFSCSSLLFPKRSKMENSDEGRVFQIGGRYICGEQYDPDLDNFEFVDVGEVTADENSQRCSSGYKECGATSSKILCVKSSNACPVNEMKVTNDSQSSTGFFTFQNIKYL